MKLNKINAIALAVSLSAVSSLSYAHNHEDTVVHKQIIPKLMAGVNLYEEAVSFDDKTSMADFSMASYAVGLEYEFTPTFGAELRHYFGGEEKRITHADASELSHDAEMESATALLLSIQTPSLWGFSAYLQGGPSMVKNSFDTVDYSNNSFAYGGGIEFQASDDVIVFLDALQFNEYDVPEEDVKSVKNRMAMLGVAMQF